MAIDPIKLNWIGINGKGSNINPNTRESIIEYTVFDKNNSDTLSKLFISFLPSTTTLGRALKSEFNNTSWATAFVASEPLAIAIPQSASFKARTSFTPSPVIATICPFDWRDFTIAFFWWGVTLPKIVLFSIISANCSLSSGKVLASTYLSALLIPALFATADTVTGLSPDIIFSSTPSFSKYWKLLVASSLIISSIRIRAVFSTLFNVWFLNSSSEIFAKRSILLPFIASSSTIDCISSYSSFKIISGAPRTHAPFSSNSTPLHFFSEENGILFFIFNSGLSLYFSNIDCCVGFILGDPWTIPARISSISLISLFSKATTSTTFNFPSVIVPVLSRHNTSTLAKTSVAGSSCTRVSHLESLITATIKVALVKSTNPSGTIPIIPEAAPITASCQLLSANKSCVATSNIPIGITSQIITLNILFTAVWSSELISLYRFASSASLAEYVSAPTLVTLA